MMTDATLLELQEIFALLNPLASIGPQRDDHPRGPFLGFVSRRSLIESLSFLQNDECRVALQRQPDRMEAAKVAFATYYEYLDRRREPLSTLTLFFLCTGAFFLLLPSVEVLVLALLKMGPLWADLWRQIRQA